MDTSRYPRSVGCLSGACVIGVVALAPQRPSAGLRDSKKYSPRQIELLAEQVYANAAIVRIAAASAAEIDQIGIVAALELAMLRALAHIGPVDVILSDGLPFAALANCAPHYESIVRGDAAVSSIAAASIVAKQMRDRLMRRLAPVAAASCGGVSRAKTPHRPAWLLDHPPRIAACGTNKCGALWTKRMA